MYIIIFIVIFIAVYVKSFKDNFTKEYIDKAAPALLLAGVCAFSLCILISILK